MATPPHRSGGDGADIITLRAKEHIVTLPLVGGRFNVAEAEERLGMGHLTVHASGKNVAITSDPRTGLSKVKFKPGKILRVEGEVQALARHPTREAELRNRKHESIALFRAIREGEGVASGSIEEEDLSELSRESRRFPIVPPLKLWNEVEDIPAEKRDTVAIFSFMQHNPDINVEEMDPAVLQSLSVKFMTQQEPQQRRKSFAIFQMINEQLSRQYLKMDRLMRGSIVEGLPNAVLPMTTGPTGMEREEEEREEEEREEEEREWEREEEAPDPGFHRARRQSISMVKLLEQNPEYKDIERDEATGAVVIPGILKQTRVDSMKDDDDGADEVPPMFDDPGSVSHPPKEDERLKPKSKPKPKPKPKPKSASKLRAKPAAKPTAKPVAKPAEAAAAKPPAAKPKARAKIAVPPCPQRTTASAGRKSSITWDDVLKQPLNPPPARQGSLPGPSRTPVQPRNTSSAPGSRSASRGRPPPPSGKAKPSAPGPQRSLRNAEEENIRLKNEQARLKKEMDHMRRELDRKREDERDVALRRQNKELEEENTRMMDTLGKLKSNWTEDNKP